MIWGASGHARVVVDAVRLSGVYNIIGHIVDSDSIEKDGYFHGAPILGGREVLRSADLSRETGIILAFGNCEGRLTLAGVVRDMGFRLATVMHPGAIISPDASIGEGSFVAAGAVVSAGARVGENVIVNTSSSVDHDCILEDGVHICPGVHLAGDVSVGRGSWIGIGSTVREKIRIGRGVTVGAGSVVVKDLPDLVVAFGVPARVVRSGTDEE